MKTSKDGVQLPKTCFVSYSFADDEALGRLQSAVPEGVELRPFPFEDPDPAEPISNGIVEALLSCEGLVRINRGRSAQSFWVKFESDYMRRLDRPVFGFDPKTGRFEPDNRPPIDLNVRVSYNPSDKPLLDQLLGWMATKRSFDLRHTLGAGHLGGVKADDEITLFETLRDGGAALWFVTPMSTALWATKTASAASVAVSCTRSARTSAASSSASRL